MPPALLTVKSQERKAYHSVLKSAKFFPRTIFRFSLNIPEMGGSGPLLLLQWS